MDNAHATPVGLLVPMVPRVRHAPRASFCQPAVTAKVSFHFDSKSSLANAHLQFVRLAAPNVPMEQELALLVNPVLLRMPTTERNVLPRVPSRRLEPRVPPKVSALVPTAALALHHVQRVQDRHQTPALPALLPYTCSTEAVSALMETAFALVLV